VVSKSCVYCILSVATVLHLKPFSSVIFYVACPSDKCTKLLLFYLRDAGFASFWQPRRSNKRHSLFRNIKRRNVCFLLTESANAERRSEQHAVASTPVGPYSPSQVSYETFLWPSTLSLSSIIDNHQRDSTTKLQKYSDLLPVWLSLLDATVKCFPFVGN